MSIYWDRGPDGKKRWRYRVVVRLPDGTKQRISGTPTLNTKDGAKDAERAHVERALKPGGIRPEVPTLSDWFDKRFWNEWVIGEGNRVGTQGEKRSAFDHHIRPALGHLPLDRIDTAAIQQFKAELAGKAGRGRDAEGKRVPLSVKTRSNILAVLSKALRYAEEAGVLAVAPRVKLLKVVPGEIECWELEEYARIVTAARREGDEWLVAVLLAGEAGLRIGEVLALKWEDLDLVAGTITVARQIRQGVEGPTKGGRPRKVPMTPRLHDELTSLATIRRGRVVRPPGAEDVSEGLVKGHRVYRLCRLAGLPERSWHALRHSFATHAALLGVNPWRLQAWLGHSTIAQTMRYVHHAEQHRRTIPSDVLEAGRGIADPDDRILAMLGARAGASYEQRGNSVPTAKGRSATRADSDPFLVRATGIEPARPGSGNRRR